MQFSVYKKSFVLLLFAVIICSVSCLSLQQDYPEKRYYLLEPQRNSEPHQPQVGSRLAVRRYRVSPAAEGRELLYRLGPQNYQADFYNVFFVAPDEMLTDATRGWLRQSALFENLVDPASEIGPTHILESNLIRIVGDFSDKSNPKAVLEIQFFLIADNDGDPTTIFSKTYLKKIPINKREAQALVEGLQTALQEILAELEIDLNGKI